MTMQSDLWPTMEMVTHGNLRLHWGNDGIRITRRDSAPLTRLTTREAKWLGTMLPIAAAVVEAISDDV